MPYTSEYPVTPPLKWKVAFDTVPGSGNPFYTLFEITKEGCNVETIATLRTALADSRKDDFVKLIQSTPVLLHAVQVALEYLEYVPETEVDESSDAYMACVNALKAVKGEGPYA